MQRYKSVVLALFVLVAVGCLPVIAEGASLPVGTLSAIKPSAVYGPAPACAMGALAYRMEFAVGGVEYALIILERDNFAPRFVLLALADGDGTPVWIGSIEPDGRLHVETELTYADIKAVAPCEFLTRVRA